MGTCMFWFALGVVALVFIFVGCAVSTAVVSTVVALFSLCFGYIAYRLYTRAGRNRTLGQVFIIGMLLAPFLLIALIANLIFHYC